MPTIGQGEVQAIANFLSALQDATEVTGVEIGYVGSTVIAVGGDPVGSIAAIVLGEDEDRTVTYVFDTDQ